MWSKCRDEGLSGNRVSSSRALRLCERLPPRHRLQLLLGPRAKIAVAPPLRRVGGQVRGEIPHGRELEERGDGQISLQYRADALVRAHQHQRVHAELEMVFVGANI